MVMMEGGIGCHGNDGRRDRLSAADKYKHIHIHTHHSNDAK